MKNTHYYFGYGLNTNIRSMTYRCPGAALLGHAVLPNHRFRFAFHADVVPDDRSTVDGALWRLSDEHMLSLDGLEGRPHYYDRRLQSVWFQDTEYEAWVYHMQPGNPDCWPSDGYLDTLIEGYTDNNMPLQQIYTALNSIENSAWLHSKRQIAQTKTLTI